MMPAQPPALDLPAVVADLTRQLADHSSKVAAGIATPAATPLIIQHADGMFTDRAGRVLVPAPKLGDVTGHESRVTSHGGSA